MTKPFFFFDSVNNVVEESGELYRSYNQIIPDEFITQLKEEQNDFKMNINGFTKVCSVPVYLVDKWHNETPPFDAMTEPIAEVVKRLRMEGMDIFITGGNKKIV